MLWTENVYDPAGPGAQLTKVGPVNGEAVKVTLVIGTATPFSVTATFWDDGLAWPAVVSLNETWLGVATSPLPLPALLPIVRETFKTPLGPPLSLAVTVSVPLLVPAGRRVDFIVGLVGKLTPVLGRARDHRRGGGGPIQR